MTFRELRRYLANHGNNGIRWNKSGIVELAALEPNGAVRIINIISQKSYILPKHYVEMDITIVQPHEMIEIGQLVPKEMRQSHESNRIEGFTRNIE